MKKTKLISLSLIICLVLMGTAFAWWTQSTTIKNTVNTGNLDVKLINIGGPGIYFTRPNGNPDSIGLDINKHYNANVVHYNFTDNYSLDVSIEKLFPGSYVTYIYGVDNTGTVPVKVEDVKLVPNANVEKALPAEKLSNLPITFCYRVLKQDNTIPFSGRVDGTYSDIAGKIKEALSNVVIVPGDRLVIGDLDDKDEFGQVQNGFIITIPEAWGNDTEDCTVSFSLQFDYTQANAYK